MILCTLRAYSSTYLCILGEFLFSGKVHEANQITLQSTHTSFSPQYSVPCRVSVFRQSALVVALLLLFMDKVKNVTKSGWHPSGKDGKKESWRGDFKGINQVVCSCFNLNPVAVQI